jgi:hypothetical protein
MDPVKSRLIFSFCGDSCADAFCACGLQSYVSYVFYRLALQLYFTSDYLKPSWPFEQGSSLASGWRLQTLID